MERGIRDIVVGIFDFRPEGYYQGLPTDEVQIQAFKSVGLTARVWPAWLPTEDVPVMLLPALLDQVWYLVMAFDEGQPICSFLDYLMLSGRHNKIPRPIVLIAPSGFRLPVALMGIAEVVGLDSDDLPGQIAKLISERVQGQ